MDFFKVKSVNVMKELIDEHTRPVSGTEDIPLTEAAGRILAQDIKSEEDVPSFSRSTVDGYAVKASDTYGASETMPGFLTVTGEVHMGAKTDLKVHPGQAVYVPTGGMMPEGSDAVVMIEDCEQVQDLLNITRSVAKNDNVILKGEDAAEGAVLLEEGTMLRPQECGALASLGISEVKVRRKPVIGYLSSGDEIVPFDTGQLKPGKIRDVNGITIPLLARQWGADIEVSRIAEDDFTDFREKAEALFNKCDAVFMSGGSSVGAKDYTTQVIESLGDNDPGLLVHGVSVKPGKPTIFSVTADKPVMGLPGHPASAMIIFQMFGRQIINKLAGKAYSAPLTTTAQVSQNIPSSPGRTDYIRVKLEAGNPSLRAIPVLGKSGLIKTLVQSDGLLEISEKKEGVKQGETVTVHYFL